MQNGYKETKIGAIPEEWKLEQLENIGEFFKGITITKSEIKETGFPCIRYGDIYVQYEFANTVTHFSAYISKETAKNGRRLLKGDIIFAGTGETQEDIGKCVAYTRDEKAFAGGDLIVFRPNKDIGIDSEFLSACLNTGEVANRKSRLGQGLSIFHIYSSHLKTLEVPLPPLREQMKITDILSTLDNSIEKTDAIIEETKQLRKGLMQKLFAEGIGHTRFKETKIGRIPEAWKVIRLDELLVKAKQRNPAKKPLEPIKYIDVSAVSNKLFRITEKAVLLGRDAPSRARKEIRVDDIIYATVRPYLKRIAMVPKELDGEICSTGYCVLRCNRDKSFPQYIFFLMLTHRVTETLKNLQVGTSYPAISDSDVCKLLVPTPPYSEQKQIAQILSEVDAKIEKEVATKAELEQLKKGLMQVLLTGKVRVKV